MTTNLDAIIIKCNSLNYFSELKTEILKNTVLTDKEKNEFIDIWNLAIDFENWNYQDLVLGCKICHKKLKETTNLSEESIGIIVRMASYEWK